MHERIPMSKADTDALAEVPNATTRRAIVELESGKGRRFASVKALMADLNAENGTVAGVPTREA
jgi:hypothetical protein